MRVGERNFMKRLVSGIMLTLLLTSMLTLAFNIQPVKAEPTTIMVPDDYPTIQGAINAASNGDTIFVRSGTYFENVVVDKTISLIGENNSVVEISSDHTAIALNITANNVNVSGFTIVNGLNAAIELWYVQGCRIEDNILTGNGNGICSYCSSNNILSNNTASDNEHYGIVLQNDWSETLVNNTCLNNFYGIQLLGSSHNYLRHNIMQNNRYNFGADGYTQSSQTLNDIDTSNTVNGKPIYYVTSVSNTVFDSFENIAALYVVDSTNITIRDLILSNVYAGITLWNTTCSLIENVTTLDNFFGISAEWGTYNRIEGSNASHNCYGVYLQKESYDSLSNNTFLGNGNGIFLDTADMNVVVDNVVSQGNPFAIGIFDSENNSIYHNSFVENPQQVYVYLSQPNSWDDGYPSGGNYWSDYNGSDLFLGENQDQLGSDGIGDTHYVIDGNNIDHCPLMNPWTPSDAAVLNITTSKRFIGEGYSAYLTALVENQGGKVENLNTTVYVGQVNVTFQTFLLKSHNSLIHTFSWDSTGFSKGNYTLSIYVEPIEGEEDLADNTMYYDWVFITIPGDVNGDRRVNVLDAILIANSFNSKPGDANWNPNADINCDDKVNILDCIILANHFGESWS
jgi:parallel beta-helix repeat protein